MPRERAKQEMYKTAKWEGQYVRIVKARCCLGLWRFDIELLDGSIQGLIDESELTDFC